MSRVRGTGSVMLRGQWWYVKFYCNGKPVVEHTHIQDTGADSLTGRNKSQEKAEKYLRGRLAEVQSDTFIEPTKRRALIGELIEDVFCDYQNNQYKSIESARYRWHANLKPFFANRRASGLKYDDLNAYVQERRAAGIQNPTIRRELSLIKRAYSLAVKSGKVSRASVPVFPSLGENPPRQGFIDDVQYDRLAEQCANEGLWLRALLAAAFDLGWRRSELLGLRVKQVDLLNRRVYLPDSKNGKPRIGVLTDEAYRWMAQCCTGKGQDGFVFSKDAPGLVPVRDFRKRWKRVCTQAGIPFKLLLHDLRRSMARKHRNEGIPEGVIMAQGGWKTRSMFDRYGIVNEADLEQAARLIDARRAQQRALQTQRALDSHKSTTVGAGESEQDAVSHVV